MKNQIEEIIDFQQFLSKVLRNWFFFIISLFFSISVAFIINRYSNEKFYSEASILIKEQNTTITPTDLLYDNTISRKAKSLENKSMLLKSYPLIYKTLLDLRFDISYYIIGNIKVSETYNSPVILSCKNTSKLTGKSLKIQIIDSLKFSLKDEKTNETYELSFGQYFKFYDTRIKVDLNNKYLYKENEIPNTIIRFKNLKVLTKSYQKRLKVKHEERESTVLNISILEGDQAFLFLY